MTPCPPCIAAVDALLRDHAAALLEQADTLRRRNPRNAEVCERQAMGLGLAAGFLRGYFDDTTERTNP